MVVLIKSKCLVGLLILAASPVVAQPTQAKFRRLFDGKSLKGWHGDARYWSVVDGAIVGNTHPDGRKKNTFLIADGEYHDFILRVKFRLKNGASGVQFRSRMLSKKPEDKFLVTGYQADIDNGGSTGEFYEEKGRSTLKRPDPAVVKKHFRKGEWNQFEIKMVGDEGVIRLNGHVTSRYKETNAKIPRSGFVALQLQAGSGMEIAFKDVEIHELKPADSGRTRRNQ